MYGDVALRIWGFAEVGYQEQQSSALLQQQLKSAGFNVKAGVAEIPTAFTAEWGSGTPVIGIIGEFDALPGLSQAAEPERRAVVAEGAGHGCGHHLFGTASTAAAIAVKEWLVATRRGGTLRFYGTPAEEGGAGKVYMLRAGLFDDVDAVVTMHPGDRNAASASTNLANITGKFRFRGLSAHASAAPERGRSALDGVYSHLRGGELARVVARLPSSGRCSDRTGRARAELVASISLLPGRLIQQRLLLELCSPTQV